MPHPCAFFLAQGWDTTTLHSGAFLFPYPNSVFTVSPPSTDRVNAEKSHDLVAKRPLLALIRPNLVPKWVTPDSPLLNSGTFQAAFSQNQAPCVVISSTKCNLISEHLAPNRDHLSDRLTSFCNHPSERLHPAKLRYRFTVHCLQNSTCARTDPTHTGPRSRLYPGLSMCCTSSA